MKLFSVALLAASAYAGKVAANRRHRNWSSKILFVENLFSPKVLPTKGVFDEKFDAKLHG